MIVITWSGKTYISGPMATFGRSDDFVKADCEHVRAAAYLLSAFIWQKNLTTDERSTVRIRCIKAIRDLMACSLLEAKSAIDVATALMETTGDDFSRIVGELFR